MRLTHILTLSFFVLCLFAIPAAAAQPEQIDVQGLHITYTANSSDAYFELTATRAKGSSVTYGGLGASGLYQLNQCYPCQMPSTLSSNGFQTGFQFNWGPNRMAYFVADASASDPIVVSPRYTWKRRTISVSGNTALHGRLEIRDQNTVIAVDPDVTLNGTYTAAFWQTDVANVKRAVEFTQIDFQLIQPSH